MAPKADDPNKGKVPVKLLLEHEDRGKLHKPGAVLWLRPDQRDRLVRADPPIAEDCADCGAAAPAPAPESKPKPAAAKAAAQPEVNAHGL